MLPSEDSHEITVAETAALLAGEPGTIHVEVSFEGLVPGSVYIKAN